MKWVRIIVIFAGLLCILFAIDGIISKSINEVMDDSASITNQIIFPHNQIVDVFIEIEEETYHTMNENAIAEEMVMANITYNGYSFSNIGIRPKGNSSLRSVANSESYRYSFKIDLDYYINDQSFYGITKLNLNNLYSDPTMMVEYLGYEMLDELGADAARTTYVALYINDQYKGLYLAVEEVDEAFLNDHFGNSKWELYKPEMGKGCDLAYIFDKGEDYTGLVPENVTTYDNAAIANLIKVIEEKGDLESVMNMDSFLKYLAMSTVTVHLDSYQSGMFHNYYLYNNNGVFEWITWDLNMIFNGFPKSGLSDAEAVEFLINEPVIGAMEKYPLVEAVFENSTYVTRYQEYIKTLLNVYLSDPIFANKVTSVYELIKGYVELDPTAFYSYSQFEESLFTDKDSSLSLLSFASLRRENIQDQLQGIIDSTNNGQGNTGSKRVRGEMNPPAQGNKANRNKNMKNDNVQGLPPGIRIEDMPEELRKYFKNGETPPIDKMKEFMDELPADFNASRGSAEGKGVSNQYTVSEDTQGNVVNIGLLLITLLGMVGFMYYLKKR